jgi:hypothetical protein
VPGFFQDTLAALGAERWAIVRLDADSYEATREALRRLYPGLAVGGHLIVDDYGSFEGCRRAVDEFRAEHGITEPLHAVDSTCVRWRREREGPAPPAAGPPPAAPEPPAGGEPLRAHVPTAHELDLAEQLDALRARLTAAEAQIGLRAWLRRRLRGGAAR